jgi:HPt (histidine-containing phosphotransfer) domain-containing protein
MRSMADAAEHISVHTADPTLVLDRQQLSDITLDDDELMREVLATLIEDTSHQIELLDSAIREQNPETCKRLAHYSKGACASVGANAAAAVLMRMELEAGTREFDRCATSLAALGAELDRLRVEVRAL